MRLDADFDDFVRSYGTPLWRAAFLLARDHGHAEDLVQSTLLRLARHWRMARSSPQAYAHRILINLSRNRWRDLNRRPRGERPVADDDILDASERHTDQVVDRDMLTTALRRLPDQQREVAVLRFILDLSVSETAVLLGVPEGTVKSTTNRALARLREHLTETSESKEMEVRCADR